MNDWNSDFQIRLFKMYTINTLITSPLSLSEKKKKTNMEMEIWSIPFNLQINDSENNIFGVWFRGVIMMLHLIHFLMHKTYL